jgi:hypothetical protein
MTLVGCDLHARKQQVPVLDTRTGEVLEQELSHEATPWSASIERCGRP